MITSMNNLMVKSSTKNQKKPPSPQTKIDTTKKEKKHAKKVVKEMQNSKIPNKKKVLPQTPENSLSELSENSSGNLTPKVENKLTNQTSKTVNAVIMTEKRPAARKAVLQDEVAKRLREREELANQKILPNARKSSGNTNLNQNLSSPKVVNSFKPASSPIVPSSPAFEHEIQPQNINSFSVMSPKREDPKSSILDARSIGNISKDIPLKVLALRPKFKGSKELECLIKWKATGKQIILDSIVDAEQIRKKYPYLLIEFYEERLNFL